MGEADLSTGPTGVYQTITAKIVEAIEAGAGEFVMPWHYTGLGGGFPVNAATARRYQGVNVLALWASAMLGQFSAGHWATYRQWQALGAQVRKGERGTVILFYKELDQAELSHEEEEPGRRFVARASHVFNAAQVDGWELPSPPVTSCVEAVAKADELVRLTGARIRHGAEYACYRPADDVILMPDRERFVGTPTSTATESYYAVLLHELTHWTGHASRLARRFDRFGSQLYAAEELVAELGAAFLCARLEIANDPRPDHAAYVAQWLKVLKREPAALYQAIREATRGVDLVFDSKARH